MRVPETVLKRANLYRDALEQAEISEAAKNYQAAVDTLHIIADAKDLDVIQNSDIPDPVAEAQTKLGDLYERGVLGEPDYKQAMSFYRKAANRGHRIALTNLGYLYEKGTGITEPCLASAIYLYDLAVNAKYPSPTARIFRESFNHPITEPIMKKLILIMWPDFFKQKQTPLITPQTFDLLIKNRELLLDKVKKETRFTRLIAILNVTHPVSILLKKILKDQFKEAAAYSLSKIQQSPTYQTLNLFALVIARTKSMHTADEKEANKFAQFVRSPIFKPIMAREISLFLHGDMLTVNHPTT